MNASGNAAWNIFHSCRPTKTLLSALALSAMLAGAEETASLEGLRTSNGVYTIPVTAQPATHAVGKVFDINPNETISISFQARAVTKNPREFGAIRTGFRLFDAAGRKIWSIHFNPVPDSETALAAAAPKGAKKILIPNCPAWMTAKKNPAIAFGAKKDLSDLPNFSASNSFTAVTAVNKKGDGLEIKLRQPLLTAHAKGESVRLHNWGREFDYMFSCWPGRNFKKYSYTFSGVGGPGKITPGKWLPGAVKAQLILSFSCRAAFKDVKIELNHLTVRRMSVKELF